MVCLHDYLKDILPFLIAVITVWLNNTQTNKKSDREDKDDTIKDLKDERDYWHKMFLEDEKELRGKNHDSK